MTKPAPYEPQWYIEAAAAATEVGADEYDGAAPEGAAISFLAAFAVVCFLAGLVILLTVHF